MVHNIHVKLLQAAGHHVMEFSYYTKSSEPLFYLRSFFRVLVGFGKNPNRQIRKFKPDVIVVNNTFPNMGIRWLYRTRIPVIQFIHNYRFECANGLFFRKGKICFECVNKSPTKALLYKCYRGSALATLPIVVNQYLRKYYNKNSTSKNTYITLSNVQEKIFSKLNYRNLVTIHNTIGLPKKVSLDSKYLNNTWVVVSRIDNGKGIENLLKKWPTQVNLDIIGDGPLLEKFKIDFSPNNFPNLKFLGAVERSNILSSLQNYEGAIFPSQTLEPGSISFIEYLYCGLPVILLETNAMKDIVNSFNCGASLPEFDPDTLNRTILDIARNRVSISKNAVEAYNSCFSSEVWINNFNLVLKNVASKI